MLHLRRWPTLGDHGRIAIRASEDQLVLSERARIRYWGVFAALALLSTPIVVSAFGSLFATYSQHLVCDRPRDVCTRNGVTLVPLHDVAGVELTDRWEHGYRHVQEYKDLTLVLRDGSRKTASGTGAASTSSVADYQAAVEAMRAFLANPSQPRLETTFVYRPGWSERIYGFIGGTYPLLFILAMLSVLPGSSYSFCQGTMIAHNGRRFGKKLTYELPMDQIAVIGDRGGEHGQGVDLQLTDGNRILLAHVRHGRLPRALLPSLQKALGKPIEQH